MQSLVPLPALGNRSDSLAKLQVTLHRMCSQHETIPQDFDRVLSKSGTAVLINVTYIIDLIVYSERVSTLERENSRLKMDLEDVITRSSALLSRSPSLSRRNSIRPVTSTLFASPDTQPQPAVISERSLSGRRTTVSSLTQALDTLQVRSINRVLL
jgi:hypothetical protein